MSITENNLSAIDFFLFGLNSVWQVYGFLLALLSWDKKTVSTNQRELAESKLPNTTYMQTLWALTTKRNPTS